MKGKRTEKQPNRRREISGQYPIFERNVFVCVPLRPLPKTETATVLVVCLLLFNPLAATSSHVMDPFFIFLVAPSFPLSRQMTIDCACLCCRLRLRHLPRDQSAKDRGLLSSLSQLGASLFSFPLFSSHTQDNPLLKAAIVAPRPFLASLSFARFP